MIFETRAEVTTLKEKMYESAEKTYEQLKKMLNTHGALEVLFKMKFDKIGYDPIDFAELNLIEQINQLFSDLVAMSALEELFARYPNKKFRTHLGAEPGFDIESLDGEIVAECFAVTMAASNGKLKKDSEKLMLKAEGRKKYIFFYSRNDLDEKLERVYEKFLEIEYVRFSCFPEE